MQLPAPPPVSMRDDLDKCIAYYTSLDTDHDGIPDWTSKFDGLVSDVLYPLDEDLDGDGVENMLDPDPLDRSVFLSTKASNGVPAHLALSGKAAKIQGELYRDFGVLAIDHTDHHSSAVLETLALVLKRSLPTRTVKSIRSLRYVYAFRGHDSSLNIAAYHRNAKAISIGGLESYSSGELSDRERIQIASAFAHELGHAFLFDRLSATDLREAGSKFGRWSSIIGATKDDDLHAISFFRSHPLRKLARLGRANADEGQRFIRKDLWKDVNFVSQYASTNLHEWFADAFAATLVRRLGEQHLLGANWRENLARLPESPGGYWVNYNNLSDPFRAWMEARIVQNKTHD